MTVTFQHSTDFETRNQQFKLEISHDEFQRLELDNWDYRVLADCNAPDSTIADKLLGLELLVRKMQGANA